MKGLHVVRTVDTTASKQQKINEFTFEKSSTIEWESFKGVWKTIEMHHPKYPTASTVTRGMERKMQLLVSVALSGGAASS